MGWNIFVRVVDSNVVDDWEFWTYWPLIPFSTARLSPRRTTQVYELCV